MGNSNTSKYCKPVMNIYDEKVGKNFYSIGNTYNLYYVPLNMLDVSTGVLENLGDPTKSDDRASVDFWKNYISKHKGIYPIIIGRDLSGGRIWYK